MNKKMRYFKKLCCVLLLVTVSMSVLVSITILRVLMSPDYPTLDSCISTDIDYISDSRSLSKRLSDAIKFQTVNYGFHDYNGDELKKFIDYLFKSFPLVHSSVSYEVVNNFSLLYFVKGSHAELKPYLLTGHMDVVPAEASEWEEQPFSGIIKDGHIWGRGTIDSKHIVMGTLEALEFLLEKGYKPKRSFYLSFGHDEESGGLDGAQHISRLLRSRGVELEYLLDEGSFVMEDYVPGIKSPVALFCDVEAESGCLEVPINDVTKRASCTVEVSISTMKRIRKKTTKDDPSEFSSPKKTISVSEKGSLNLELKVKSTPGHSSFPSEEPAIVILSKALSKLKGNVFPSMFGKGPEEALFEELAHCAPFSLKVVFKNLWLFKYPVVWYMSDPIMSALHRTTTAVTIVAGGNKINVLPSFATANVNLRVHPAQTINQAVEFVRDTVRDERVEMSILSQDPPHPFSPTHSFGYSTIKKTIRQIYNDSCVAPMTLIANTDSRWYLNLTRNVYRFSLIRMRPEDMSRFHGHNERISVDNYVQVVNFFLHLIKNSDLPSPPHHGHDEL